MLVNENHTERLINVYTKSRYIDGVLRMEKIAKVFLSGHSQAVRIPKEFRIEGSEVTIRRRETDGALIIKPMPKIPKGYNNILSAVLARNVEASNPFPDVSEFFARDKTMPKEIF